MADLEGQLDRLSQLEEDLQDELQYRQPGTVDFRQWREYYDRPISFILDLLTTERDQQEGRRKLEEAGLTEEGTGYRGYGPWKAQHDIAAHVRDWNLNVVHSCNKAGKDWLAARLALWWVYARGGRVLITGPTGRQVKKVVMTEVGIAFHGSGLPGELYTSELRVDLGDAEPFTAVLAMTSSSASKLTGFHRTPIPGEGILVLMTEAQDVEAFAWEGLLRNAGRDQDRFLAFGNPYEVSGKFYESCQDPSWHPYRIDGLDHPNVLNRAELVPGGLTHGYCERIKRQAGGEESALYKSAVRGMFAQGAADRLVPDLGWLSSARERHGQAVSLMRESLQATPPEAWPSLHLEDPRGRTLLVGVDVARSGEDSSVLVFRRGGVVTDFVEMAYKTRTTDVSGRVALEMRSRGFKPDPENPDPGYLVLVDEIGIGAGVVDELHEAGWNVRGINVSGKPPKPYDERYLNRRAWGYWLLRVALEASALVWPEGFGKKMDRELLAHTWKPNGQGKIQLVAKDTVRAELGNSPDYSDALMLTYQAADAVTGIGFSAVF